METACILAEVSGSNDAGQIGATEKNAGYPSVSIGALPHTQTAGTKEEGENVVVSAYAGTRRMMLHNPGEEMGCLEVGVA